MPAIPRELLLQGFVLLFSVALPACSKPGAENATPEQICDRNGAKARKGPPLAREACVQGFDDLLVEGQRSRRARGLLDPILRVISLPGGNAAHAGQQGRE